MLGINNIGSDQLPHESRRPSQISAVHSHTSSLHSQHGHNVHQQSSPESPKETERLLSQYPPEPENNHVEFILVAHFDIGQGSIMEYQYPNRITDDEELLAQLMLPEGAHSRQQDWTVFLLHKEGRGEGDRNTSPRASFPTDTQTTNDFDEAAQEGADRETDGEDDDEVPHGPPLTYVLNLVNRRYDSSVKR